MSTSCSFIAMSNAGVSRHSPARRIESFGTWSVKFVRTDSFARPDSFSSSEQFYSGAKGISCKRRVRDQFLKVYRFKVARSNRTFLSIMRVLYSVFASNIRRFLQTEDHEPYLTGAGENFEVCSAELVVAPLREKATTESRTAVMLAIM